MPELPEAEVVRRGLQQWFAGRTIADVDVHDVRALTPHGDDAVAFSDALRGVTLRYASRRGKYLWFSLDDGQCLAIHLGMSGQVLVRDDDTPVRHERVRVRCDDGGPDMVFADQRLFGYMAIVPAVPTPDGLPDSLFVDEDAVVPRTVAHIARDVLDPFSDDGAVSKAMRKKRTGVKRALLDQTLISGVGNIYADEALWRARLHYDRPTRLLSHGQAVGLIGHCRDVMEEALAAGGTSFDPLYVNVNGASGYFSRSLEAYGQAERPCSRCGSIIVREEFMNRSSFRCPRCQRRPRTRRVGPLPA